MVVVVVVVVIVVVVLVVDVVVEDVDAAVEEDVSHPLPRFRKFNNTSRCCCFF